MVTSSVITGSNNMSANDRFKPLSINDEVLSISSNERMFNDYPMFKVKSIITKLKYMLEAGGGYNLKTIEKCFSEGVDCELLKFGAKGWEKGKIRVKLTVEFCPDEPEVEATSTNNQLESPLDDIRQMIN